MSTKKPDLPQVEDYSLLKAILLAPVVIVAMLFVSTAFNTVSFTTADDTSHLFEILQRTAKRNILGASNDSQDYLKGCSEEAPVIGWIDYRGEKVVVDTLPDSEDASACFVDLDEAAKQGFFPQS